MAITSTIPYPTAGSLIAPLFLRVVIGLTFLWAGLGKLTTEFEVSGAPAATLASMGVRGRAVIAVPGEGVIEIPAIETVRPGAIPDRRPLPTEPLMEPEPVREPVREPDAEPAITPGTPVKRTAPQPAAEPALRPAPLMRVQASGPVVVVSSERMVVSGVYGIALLVKAKADPVPDAAGITGKAILPRTFGEGRWPVYLAWTAAITELVGGVMLLVGLFTRLGAFALTGTMLMAVWLTEVGPAMAAGTAKWGFLPAHGWFEMDAAGNYAFAKFGWQMALLAGSAALMFLGGGFLSLDRLLFPRKGYVVESRETAIGPKS